jgi:hypothetical protein
MGILSLGRGREERRQRACEQQKTTGELLFVKHADDLDAEYIATM